MNNIGSGLDFKFGVRFDGDILPFEKTGCSVSNVNLLTFLNGVSNDSFYSFRMNQLICRSFHSVLNLVMGFTKNGKTNIFQ